jgi:hypothetical protein
MNATWSREGFVTGLSAGGSHVLGEYRCVFGNAEKGG